MLAFLDRLMGFVEKRCTLTFCLCMGYSFLVCGVFEGLLGLDDWVWELCMVPLNLLFWPLLIIWWREFRQGVYAAQSWFVSRLAMLPALEVSCPQSPQVRSIPSSQGLIGV